MPSALESGSSHNVEFARLKVKNGDNAGKYYVYIKTIHLASLRTR